MATEFQPLLKGSLRSITQNDSTSNSSLTNKAATLLYAVVSIVIFLTYVLYQRNEASLASGVTHWHTVSSNDDWTSNMDCPAICGVGYHHVEDISPLIIENGESATYSAEVYNGDDSSDDSTILVGRIVQECEYKSRMRAKNEKPKPKMPFQEKERDGKRWLISQRLKRCSVETACVRDKIESVETSDASGEEEAEEEEEQHDWEYFEDSDELDEITIQMAIKQSNSDFEIVERELLKISDPDSEYYGQHWTFEQIHDFFKPPDESHKAVMAWLHSYGILDKDIRYLTMNGDFIEMTMSVKQANDLLGTKFGRWKHKKTGTTHVRVKNSYTVPSHVSPHLDFVSPTLRFPVKKHMAKMTPLPSTVGWVTDKDDTTFAKKRLVDLSDFEESENGDFILVSGDGYGNDNEISDEGSTKRLLKKKDVDKGDANNDESSSSTSTIYNTPNRLSQLYVMHQQNGAASGNSQAVASFLKEWYSVDDVEEFAEYFGIDVLDITNVPDTQPEGYGTEAELDVEYMTAMGRGIHTYVWDIEDSLYFVSLVQQLEQTDGRPLIVSMSYGGDEQSNGEQYCSRASIEFAKVGLLGVTFFASSGDNGACGSSGSCGSTGEYLPSFPASSPFVTAVGGTYGGSVVDSNKVAQIEEEEGGGNSGGSSIKKQVEEEFNLEKYNEYCDRSTQESAWYNGGGGFSSFFDRPSYQDEAIENYFNSYDSNSATNGKKLDTKRFNTNGRGYPDISGQAVNYVICDESLFWLISGTSAATPSVAGMFGMINDYRLRNGKTSLGFLNPYLYKLYSKNMKTLTKNEYLNIKEGRRRMLGSNGNGIGKNDGDRKQLVGDESDMDSILSRLGSISNDNNNNNKNKDKDKDKEDETLVYQVSKNIYFNDVTDGYNQGCGSSRKAFSAIDGWDAATGLGTINFANLVKEFAGVNQT